MATTSSTILNRDLLDFISKSPTAFHATESMAKELLEEGFVQLNEADEWELESGKRYFVTRNNSSLIAFKLSKKDIINDGIRMLGAHTDAPALKVKPHSEVQKKNYMQLGVEIYGGAILSTWFDRDLSLAGRVCYQKKNGQLAETLVDFKRAIAYVPNIAIHLNREVNDKRSINKQKEMAPVILQADKQPTLEKILLDELRKQKINQVKILDHDLFFYDTQPAAVVGLKDDFIVGARLDNLLSCFVGMKAIVEDKADVTTMLICNDHEECGSASTTGASGTFLKDVLIRMMGSEERLIRAMNKSMLVSADNAHAVHPNYVEKHEPAHTPLLNAGPVIKINANQRYATNSRTGAVFAQCSAKVKVPLQKFVIRTDLPCGSTIGPLTSTLLGIPTLDIGVPTFGMHSIRETAGTKDSFYLFKAMKEFLKTRDLLKD